MYVSHPTLHAILFWRTSKIKIHMQKYTAQAQNLQAASMHRYLATNLQQNLAPSSAPQAASASSCGIFANLRAALHASGSVCLVRITVESISKESMPQSIAENVVSLVPIPIHIFARLGKAIHFCGWTALQHMR